MKQLGFIELHKKEYPAVRPAALALCVVVVAAFLFLSYISGHVHDNDGPEGCCAACTHIVPGLNKALEFDAAPAASAFILFSLCKYLKPSSPNADLFTPVDLKVRLNNLNFPHSFRRNKIIRRLFI